MQRLPPKAKGSANFPEIIWISQHVLQVSEANPKEGILQLTKLHLATLKMRAEASNKLH